MLSNGRGFSSRPGRDIWTSHPPAKTETQTTAAPDAVTGLHTPNLPIISSPHMPDWTNDSPSRATIRVALERAHSLVMTWTRRETAQLILGPFDLFHHESRRQGVTAAELAPLVIL